MDEFVGRVLDVMAGLFFGGCLSLALWTMLNGDTLSKPGENFVAAVLVILLLVGIVLIALH